MEIKYIIKKLIIFGIFPLLIFFIWEEWNNISIYKKIDTDKFSAFFTILNTMATSLTIYLLYKQNIDQQTQIKVSTRPNLYPQDQFFNKILEKNKSINLKKNKKNNIIISLFSLHNIGIAASKDIKIKWHFSRDNLSKYFEKDLFELYKNKDCDSNYLFIKANCFIDIPFPLMYIQSILQLNNEYECEWHELILELSYKDINENLYTSNFFKVTTYVGAMFVSFRFEIVDKNIK